MAILKGPGEPKSYDGSYPAIHPSRPELHYRYYTHGT